MKFLSSNTNNFHLNLPASNEIINTTGINENFNRIDKSLGDKFFVPDLITSNTLEE